MEGQQRQVPRATGNIAIITTQPGRPGHAAQVNTAVVMHQPAGPKFGTGQQIVTTNQGQHVMVNQSQPVLMTQTEPVPPPPYPGPPLQTTNQPAEQYPPAPPPGPAMY